ncbi:hypothetical protein ACJJTC_005312 [Scirpophaga incertulas]
MHPRSGAVKLARSLKLGEVDARSVGGAASRRSHAPRHRVCISPKRDRERAPDKTYGEIGKGTVPRRSWRILEYRVSSITSVERRQVASWTKPNVVFCEGVNPPGNPTYHSDDISMEALRIEVLMESDISQSQRRIK